MRKISLLAPLLAVTLSACDSSVATLTFVSFDPSQPKIGDVITVTYKLTDYRGEPLAGTNVHFRLEQDKPGVKLSPTDSPSLKGSGTASTQLTVTGTVSAVIVVASSGDKEVRSPPISVAGTTASARGFTFQCGEFAGKASGGIHALGVYDWARNMIAGSKLNCHAHVVDRNGDGIAGAVVSFLTEAGTIGGSGTSVSDVVGNADILYKATYPLPLGADTDPTHVLDPNVFTWMPAQGAGQTGDLIVPLWMVPWEWTTNPFGTITQNTPPAQVQPVSTAQEPRRTDPIRKMTNGNPIKNNPRDNLVTMIAFTSGEEAYFDANNNGKYDENIDTFTDLTEPFVDSNDDGQWSPGELYVDLNADGVWNGANGMWDENTIIWVAEKIIWTGIPADEDYLNPEPVARAVQRRDGQPIYIGCNGGVVVELDVSDPWFNGLARNGENDGCTLEGNQVVTGKGGLVGMAFDYPSVTVLDFELQDALQRQPAPMTSPPQPGCFPPPAYAPVVWEAAATCTFTSSPLEGYKVVMGEILNGTSANNFPIPP